MHACAKEMLTSLLFIIVFSHVHVCIKCELHRAECGENLPYRNHVQAVKSPIICYKDSLVLSPGCKGVQPHRQ